MPVVMVSTAPDRDVYDRVSKFVDISGDRPAGLILHAASELSTGEVQIFDVWDSEESVAAFAEQRMMPAFADAGILDTVRSRPRPVHHVTFALIS
jgi:hypothetical protein